MKGQMLVECGGGGMGGGVTELNFFVYQVFHIFSIGEPYELEQLVEYILYAF